MAGLVDYEALVLDLRGRLAERASWGSGQVRDLIDRLEQEHRVDEADEAAVLRRFGGHLTDVFLGLVPRPYATSDPLTAADPRTAEAMDDGASSDHPQEGIACPPHPRDSRRTPPRPTATRTGRVPVPS